MNSISIMINFEKAKAQANRLEELSKQINKLSADSMEDSFDQISANWQGESADTYLKKGRKVQEEIQQVSEDLQSTADSIRRIAKISYDAEMRALELAQKRKA